MSTPTLEQRVAQLESQIMEMQAELSLTRKRAGKDWRRTIGAFTLDEGVKEILRDALRLREEDRKKSRSKRGGKRKPNG